MELFPVKRYFGEEEKGPKDEQKIVKKNMRILMAKIEERAKLKTIKDSKTSETNNHCKESLSPTDIKFTSNYLEEDPDIKPKSRNAIPIQDGKMNETKFTNKIDPETLVNDIDRLKFTDSDNIDGKNEVEMLNNEESFASTNTGAVVSNEVFPIIGDFKFKKKKKVKRFLPDWLANPFVVSVDLKNLNVSVNDIPELHPTLVNTLKKHNVTHFFPVQAQVIPWLLSSIARSSHLPPGDVCVSAPTGSGKTLAYALPILQALMGARVGEIQALVVLPVQDLAAQVAAVLKSYSVGTGVKIHLSSGALPLSDDRSQLLRNRLGVGWENLVDVLVTTPGRLVEHLYSTPGFSLRHLRFIVIDEADRVVSSMQNNWLHHLDQHLNIRNTPPLTLQNLRTMARRPQKLLFSATLSSDPEKLNELNLFQPRLFTSVLETTKSRGEFIGQLSTPAELEERVVYCVLATKPMVVFHLVTRPGWSRVLVFTSNSRTGHHLTELLRLLSEKTRHSLQVAEISAECSPKVRQTVLSDFALGKVDVLVSTDSLARGMDIPDVQYVISYDLPKYIEAYIHRVGRTGRAGQQGVAVTMVSHTQVGVFRHMIETAGKLETVKELTVDEKELRALEEPFKESLKKLKSVTQEEEIKNLSKEKSLKRVTSSKQLTKKRKLKKSVESVSKKLKKHN